MQPNAAAGSGGEALRWWTPSQLASVAFGLDTAWREWQVEWGTAPGDGAAASCVAAHDAVAAGDAAWQSLGARGRAAAWVQEPQQLEAAIYAALFGAPAHRATPERETMAWEMATLAWRAARDRLMAVLSLDAGDAAPPGRNLMLPWSGAVCVSLPVRHGSVVVLLESACVQSVLNANGAAAPALAARMSPGPLVPVTLAVADRQVSLRVELEGCEMELGALQALRVGDVVRLRHGLDTPLRMLGEGQRVCGGWLGRRGGSKAVELTAQASA